MGRGRANEAQAHIGSPVCVACGYSLQGHSSNVRCPECNFLHDQESRIWYSNYTHWHFRNQGPARCLLIAWAILAVLFRRISTGATAAFLMLLSVLMVTVAVIRRIDCGRWHYAYIAAVPDGLLLTVPGDRAGST